MKKTAFSVKKACVVGPRVAIENGLRQIPTVSPEREKLYAGIDANKDAFSVSAVSERFMRRYGAR